MIILIRSFPLRRALGENNSELRLSSINTVDSNIWSRLLSNMRCQTCNSELESPGDYCLVCRSKNCKSVYVNINDSGCVVKFLTEDEILGEKHIGLNIDNRKFERRVERNFIGRIVDTIRRKRPESIYVKSNPDKLRMLRSKVERPNIIVFNPGEDEDEIDEIQSHMITNGLETVESNAKEKIGGKHTTVIGGRKGESALYSVATNPFVKKIIPGPIDGGGNSGGGFRSEVTRSGSDGNIRILLKQGGTVQTIRVVTTASDRDGGKKVKKDIQEIISEG